MGITKKLRTVSFCSGYSGIERGLELVGENVRVVAYSEIEAYAVANLVAKMEEGQMDPAPVWTDLTTFPLDKFRDNVDLLTGGFPCQPFSTAGSREADEDPRHLFPHFKRFAKVVRPRFIFLENVDGIASAKLAGENWGDPKGTPVLLHVCRELERVGYKVAAGCFSAREVGAPHKRRRWFILGELGHSAGVGLCGGQSDCCEQQSEMLGSGSKSDKLDNPIDAGFPRQLWNTQDDEKRRQSETRSITATSIPPTRWPAPPGPYQYEWEEPRTVADGKHERCGGREAAESVREGVRLCLRESQQAGLHLRGETERRSGNGQTVSNPTQPQLGRTIDGSTCRVDATANRLDRLKLCGNGVVPQTAAIAWITLRNQLNQMKKVLNAHYLR